jgi:glycosyltransferase involved in cell wall biosynthesis
MPIEPVGARGADAIFSHIWYPLQGRSHGKPVIWSSQGISPARYYQYVNRGRFDVEDVVQLYRVLGRDASALLIWTDAGAKRLVDACPFLDDKVSVIPAPIVGAEDEVDTKPSARDGVIRLLFIGGDAERKGLREALGAFESARHSVGSAIFTVVSRPSADLRKKLEATRDVRLVHSSSSVDVSELMKESDILVLPTKADTYALTAVEAMARGCAVLISDLEPLPEVVPDGKVGFVVPIGDVNALARRMRDLMAGGSLLRTMQAEARKRYLERHSPAVFRARLEQLAAAVLHRSRLPHVAMLATHPTQFTAPMYRHLTASSRFDLDVYFTSSDRVPTDPELGRPPQWDIDLLDGYRYHVLPTRGLLRWRQLTELTAPGRYQAVVVSGWGDWVSRTVILLGLVRGTLMAVHSDTVSLYPRPRGRAFVRGMLTSVLFPFVPAFMATGSLAKSHLQELGVAADRIFRLPYAVDDASISVAAREARAQRAEIRGTFGIPADHLVLLAVAKFVPREGVFDLLKAYASLVAELGNLWLLIVGEGIQREEFEHFVVQNQLDRVVFMGYQPYSRLPRFYAMADVFVHPAIWESWGVSVNEAMACGLPVIVSDLVGSGHDLVRPENGTLYRGGDATALADAIRSFATVPPATRATMGVASAETVEAWGYRTVVEELESTLKYLGKEAR